ncbi:MAG: T9SS type A sorting domain-containing protein [Ignavibacteriales bacterium]|nr:MAG: T9SS type A sorting domain-containing protein [Ignavibacteriales bacterium]
MKSWFFRLLILLVLILIRISYGQWQTGPLVDNVICIDSSTQINSRIATDGDGGAFIVWQDSRNYAATGHDIYIQRINKDGYTVFANNGIPVCRAGGDQLYPQVVESDNGSAIIFWFDNRTNYTNSTDLYAQKIDAQGNILWTIDGVPVSDYSTNIPGAVVTYNILKDDDGGAFIAWQLNYYGYGHIRAQRINTDGNILWDSTGTKVTDGARDDRLPQIINDKLSGGIVIVHRSHLYGVSAQRLDADGNLLWAYPGVLVFPDGPQNECSITPGDIYSNGGLVAITFAFYGPVYAQLLDTLGNKLWGPDGIVVNNLSGGNVFAKIENNFDENEISPFSPGVIDSTFGVGGITSTTIQSFSTLWDAALQSDDKIVTVGFSSPGLNSDNEFSLARYNSDGTLDNTFGTGGVVHHSVTNGSDWIKSVAIQPDGKIIAAGEGQQDGIYCFALARYNPDGSLDNTFGSQGTTITIVDSAHYNTIHSIALQSDGKIIVASGYFGILARYNNDGTLDNTFGMNGFIQTEADFLESVVIQDNGKIVAVGSNKLTSSEYDFIIVRYNPDGSIDSTFGSNGLVTTHTGAEWESFFTVKIQDDGKIITGGLKGLPYAEKDAVLMRFHEDGSPDNSFGVNGIVISPTLEIVNSIQLQADGKIVAGGNVDSVSQNSKDFALTRYNTDGSLDISFGDNGTAITVFEPVDLLDNDIQKVLILSDSKIVAAGSSSYSANVRKNVLISYYGGSKIIGNYYLSWLHSVSFQGYEIYAQKLDVNGNLLWTQNGIQVSNSLTAYADDETTHQIFFNGENILSTWQDTRANTNGIYAQLISQDGQLLWGNQGMRVSSLTARMNFVKSQSQLDDAAVIIAFHGNGNPVGTFSNVYAKYISSEGVLPVELTSFSAELIDDAVKLSWVTMTEVNNFGFEIERLTEINPTWQKIGFVAGNGNSNTVKTYSFVDTDITAGRYVYRFKQIDNDGRYEYSQEIEINLGMPDAFSLEQNYPNPFNPATTIQYTIPNVETRDASSLHVMLQVYDILGSEITTLVNEEKPAGTYEVVFNASDLPSGVYFYSLSAGNFKRTKKFVLMK